MILHAFIHLLFFLQTRKVYNTALAMYTRGGPSAGATSSTAAGAGAAHWDLPFLFWSFAEMELHILEIMHTSSSVAPTSTTAVNVVLNILASCADGQYSAISASSGTIAPTRAVRVRKAFLSLVAPTTFASSGAAASATLLSWRINPLPAESKEKDKDPYPYLLPASPRAFALICFAWFQYLSAGLDAALAVFHSYVFAFARDGMLTAADENGYERGGVQHEWLLTMYVRLVLWHATSHPTPPRLVRAALHRALQEFPANAFFMALYVQQEGHGQLSTRLRRYFDGVTTHSYTGGNRPEDKDTVVTVREPSSLIWLYSIASELHRPSAGHRIQSLFEKALETPARSMVALWRLYIHYLLQRAAAADTNSAGTGTISDADFVSSSEVVRLKEANALRQEAKRVYFRAVHQCPWSKLLWLEGLCWLVPLETRVLATKIEPGTAIPLQVLAEQEKGPPRDRFEDVLSEEEVTSVLDMMMEKEIRLHVLATL